jgi:hypothetical protein
LITPTPEQLARALALMSAASDGKADEGWGEGGLAEHLDWIVRDAWHRDLDPERHRSAKVAKAAAELREVLESECDDVAEARAIAAECEHYLPEDWRSIDENLWLYGQALRFVDAIANDFAPKIKRGAPTKDEFGILCVFLARSISECDIPWSVAKDGRINSKIVRIVATLVDGHPEAKSRTNKLGEPCVVETVREAIRAQLMRDRQREPA